MHEGLFFITEDVAIAIDSIQTAESLIAILGDPRSMSANIDIFNGIEMTWEGEASDKMLMVDIGSDGEALFTKVVFDDNGDHEEVVNTTKLFELQEWLNNNDNNNET